MLAQLKRRPFLLVIASILALTLLYVVITTQVAVIVITVFAGMSLVTASLEYSWRTYARRTPEAQAMVHFPAPQARHLDQRKSFSLIVPAYHEAGVIGKTLSILATQSYDNYEILVSLRSDDPDTIADAKAVETRHPDKIRVFVNEFTAKNDNKSTQMNAVLGYARGEFTAPIDAEDIVAQQLLAHVDQLIHETQSDVIQCGVQLTNLDLSHGDEPWLQKLKQYIGGGWFAVHNVMEYYFWFSSRMFFQVESGFVPLGGNTVFIRTEILREIGGWDVRRLAEDCAIGTYISVHCDAKFVAAYSARLATQEHTPPHIFGGGGLFRQRVRWDQGFWQVLNDREWLKLPTIRQRVMALYILAMPLIQAINGVMLPISVAVALFVKAPVPLVMVLFTPFVPLVLIMVIQLIALREFSKEFGIPAQLRHYVSLVVGFFPYQVLLGMAAVVGVTREARGIYSWTKTARSQVHHQQIHVPAVATDT